MSSGLAVRILTAHNISQANAYSVAYALLSAQIDGHTGHGLSRLESYCAQAASGKVDGYATPIISEVSPAAVRIDAGNGFAYNANERG